MRKLSVWAKHHPVHARSLIVISRCSLASIGYFLGTQLSQYGIELSPLCIFFLIAVFFVTGALYPEERSSKNYLKRKVSDSIVAVCSFLLIVCVVNDLNRPSALFQSAKAVAIVGPSPYKYAEAKKLLEQFQKGEKTHFTSREKRIIKKEFNYQLFQYAKARLTGNKVGGGQIALIILACVAAVGLLYLVAGLACTLSCNGSDAAAIIVAILGTAGIIWGLIAVIRAIIHKKPKTKTEL